jgi:lysophospholipase L1-like esterase
VKLSKKITFSLVWVLMVVGSIEFVGRVIEGRFPTRNIDYGLGFYLDSRIFAPIDAQRVRVRKQKSEWFEDQTVSREPEPGVPRILLIGGSSVNSLYDIHDYLSEVFANAAGVPRVDVINMGGDSYGTVRLVQVLAQGLEFKPDLVVVYSGHNEIQDLQQHEEALRHSNELHRFLARHSAVFRLARDQFDAAYLHLIESGFLQIENNMPVEIDEVFATYEKNIEAMVDSSRAAGAEIVLGIPVGNLYQPNGLAPDEIEDLTIAYKTDVTKGMILARELVLAKGGELQVTTRHQKIIEEVAARKQVQTVNLEHAVMDAEPDGIPGQTLFIDHCHLNVEGNRLWVRTVAPVGGDILRKRLEDSYH